MKYDLETMLLQYGEMIDTLNKDFVVAPIKHEKPASADACASPD
jgi:hypothetical protein